MWDGSVQAAPVRPGGQVALRCADGRVFLGQPGGPADQGAFTALSDDPFVARTLVDVPGFWTWAREGAVPGQRGSLVIALKGEPVGLNAGRLTIDAYSAIAAPFSDTIELASPDGWWRQPDDDIGLQAATRGPGRPADVTGLSSDRNRDGTRLLCLTAATRQIMAADGPLRRTEDCRDWTGQDAVWVWQQTGAGPTATAIPLNGGEMTRLLEAGQFADLIVTGAPTALPSGEIVAPTRLGATVIGAQGAQGVYARDRGGALLRSSTGVPLLVDAGGVLALGEAGPLGCPAVQELAARLPDGVAIRRIELRDRRAATLTVQAADGRRQIRLPCADIGKALYWAEVMDVSDRPRLLANAAEWPDRAGQLVVAVTAQGFDLGSGGGRGVSVPGLPEGPALALFSGQNGRATFLLSERDFTRVDTDHAISLVAQQAGPLAPLAGPFPAAAAVAAPQEAAQPQPPVQPAPPVQPQPPVQPAPDPAPPTAQSAMPPDSSPLRVLTKEDARAVQAALRALGRYDGAIDGAVGPVTRAALRQWQRDQRLAPTGALTQNQFVALLGGGGP